MYVNQLDLNRPLTARVEEGFDFCSAEYRDLFRRSGATAFQRPLWLHAIYTVLAPQLGAIGHVITVREGPDGTLLMVVPLVIQKSLGVKVLQPADLGVSDCNSIVAEPGTMASLAGSEDLASQMRQLLSAGDVLIFRKVSHAVSETASILGLTTSSLNENSGFAIDMGAGEFEDWQRSQLKKRFRKSTSRRLRKLKADYRSVEFVTFEDPEKIEPVIRFISERRAARFSDDILHQQAYRDFYLHYALTGAATGEAVTSGLVVDGQLISADFGIVADNVYHSILCAARLETYGPYSPGLLGLMELIRWRRQLGERRFDFGVGATRQKAEFGASECPLHNLTMATNIKGRAVSLIYRRARPLKTLLRRSLARIR